MPEPSGIQLKDTTSLTVYDEEGGDTPAKTAKSSREGFFWQMLHSAATRRRKEAQQPPQLLGASAGSEDEDFKEESPFWLWVAKNALTLQSIPLQVPLWAGLLCIWLYLFLFWFMPAQAAPLLPWFAMQVPVIAFVFYVVAKILDDLRLARLKLLSPQRRLVGAMIVVAGLTLPILRIISLRDASLLSPEYAKRVIYGVPFWLFRFVGLDMWGFGIGGASRRHPSLPPLCSPSFHARRALSDSQSSHRLLPRDSW